MKACRRMKLKTVSFRQNRPKFTTECFDYATLPSYNPRSSC